MGIQGGGVTAHMLREGDSAVGLPGVQTRHPFRSFGWKKREHRSKEFRVSKKYVNSSIDI